VNEAQFNVMQI